MAILGMEGFDHYITGSAGSPLNEVENYTTDEWSYVDVKVLSRLGSGKSLELAWVGELEISTGTSITNTMYVSCAFRVSTIDVTRTPFSFRDKDQVNNQCYVQIDTTGHFKLYNGDNTLKATSTNALENNRWYWLEIKVFISDTGSFELKIDGTSTDWINEASVDTQNSTITPLLGGFRLYSGSGSSTYTYFDDLAWQDDAGDWLGDSRIETFVPTGDATITWDNSTASGTNASHIDEIPVSDADYVYTAAVEEDLYDFDTIADDDTVHAVSIQYRAQKSDTGDCTIQSRHSRTSGQGGGARVLSTTWLEYADIFETDGTIAWTKDNIGTATFGLKRTV